MRSSNAPINESERPPSGAYRSTPGACSSVLSGSHHRPAHSPDSSRFRGSLAIVLPPAATTSSPLPDVPSCRSSPAHCPRLSRARRHDDDLMTRQPDAHFARAVCSWPTTSTRDALARSSTSTRTGRCSPGLERSGARSSPRMRRQHVNYLHWRRENRFHHAQAADGFTWRCAATALPVTWVRCRKKLRHCSTSTKRSDGSSGGVVARVDMARGVCLENLGDQDGALTAFGRALDGSVGADLEQLCHWRIASIRHSRDRRPRRQQAGELAAASARRSRRGSTAPREPPCFPIEWVEPGGTAMIESLALACPVIGCRRGCLPEARRHGRTGLLADLSDENGLAAPLLAAPPSNRRSAQAKLPGVHPARHGAPISSCTSGSGHHRGQR